MAQEAFCVGIDVCKPWLDAYRHPDGACQRFANDAEREAVLRVYREAIPALQERIKAGR